MKQEDKTTLDQQKMQPGCRDCYATAGNPSLYFYCWQGAVFVPEPDDYAADLAALEQDYGAKIGVYALDLETNREISYQADERFAYCSTF